MNLRGVTMEEGMRSDYNLTWRLGRDVRIGFKVLSLLDCKTRLSFEVREDDREQWEVSMHLLSDLLTCRGQQGTSVACHHLKLRT